MSAYTNGWNKIQTRWSSSLFVCLRSPEPDGCTRSSKQTGEVAHTVRVSRCCMFRVTTDERTRTEFPRSLATASHQTEQIKQTKKWLSEVALTSSLYVTLLDVRYYLTSRCDIDGPYKKKSWCDLVVALNLVQINMHVILYFFLWVACNSILLVQLLPKCWDKFWTNTVQVLDNWWVKGSVVSSLAQMWMWISKLRSVQNWYNDGSYLSHISWPSIYGGFGPEW